MCDPDGGSASLSVLFSEPKIPQFHQSALDDPRWATFSALQRAENSSIRSHRPAVRCRRRTFSALQRAENSSICGALSGASTRRNFQCSSASRKFLNTDRRSVALCAARFQCSSASRKFLNRKTFTAPAASSRLSVLFSEPKIPQCDARAIAAYASAPFSALQRAENSSICRIVASPTLSSCLSVLFSEPKIPQFVRRMNV